MVKPQQEQGPALETVSMTGFATLQGAGEGYEWGWEIRSVNGKGLDLRLRLPELEGLEARVRRAVSAVVRRGNLQVSLRLTRLAGEENLRVNPAALEAALEAVVATGAAARARGVELVAPRPTDILALRGVLEAAPPVSAAPETLLRALMDDFDRVLADFLAMRLAEGRGIGAVVAAQIDRIAALACAAAEAAEARRPEVARALHEGLARVMEGAPGADAQRVAQELALLAVKSDITEEIDRLQAHVVAARALLADPGAVGRKLDFLTQEFVREANTLCSKSGSAALTAIGLDLKAVIDQMREQVQNLE